MTHGTWDNGAATFFSISLEFQCTTVQKFKPKSEVRIRFLLTLRARAGT